MKLTVYHGSLSEFTKPSLDKSKNYRDFGNGFYVTENYYDALNILNCKSGFVYEYELNLNGLMIKEFSNDEEVIDYIIENRTSIMEDNYDVVIGKTLCGCARFFKEVRNGKKHIDKSSLLSSLKQTPYTDQICLKTNQALNKLKLINIHCYVPEDFN